MSVAGTPRHRVLIAGGGIAGLEALVALHALARDRVDVTLLAPSTHFALRADTVTAAFGRPAPAPYDIAMIAADHDALFLHDGLHAVRREHSTALTESGRDLAYDSLLVAIGAQAHPHPALHDALCFRGAQDVPAMAQLLADVDAGTVTSTAFVIPPGATWTLPLYELALLTAEHAETHARDLAITVVTPEPTPAAALGRQASELITRSLEERGIALRVRSRIQRLEGDRLMGFGGNVAAQADRVVALPLLTGPRTRGLPHDSDGFIPVDGFGAIRGVPGAYGAGDATTAPFKQGGLAAQQAEVAVRGIAGRAGAKVTVEPLHPMLRAHVATGSGATWFRTPVTQSSSRITAVAEIPLWWPPAKVAVPRLAAYLERIDIPSA